MLALPVASALGCHAENKENKENESSQGASSEKGVLRVVLNGAFAIVIQKNGRNRLRIFSPKELSNLHEFYFNDPTRPESKNQTHNFELLPDGLQVSTRAPEIDTALAAFNLGTDLWCQDEYFITIDVPAPARIGFMPPLHRAVLANDGPIQVPSNFVLEYRISDPAKVRMVSQDMKETPPLYFSDLVKRYGGVCGEKVNEKSKSECDQMKRRYESGFPGSAPGYFFGVGLAYNRHDPLHALQFFNQRILASFPHLVRKLELKSIDSSSGNQSRSAIDSNSQLIPALWQPAMNAARLRQVGSVVDCTIAGPIITFPVGVGG